MKMRTLFLTWLSLWSASVAGTLTGASKASSEAPRPGDEMIAAYFRHQTKLISSKCLSGIRTLDDWTRRRERHRRELFEMLSLSPLPERGDLRPAVTGRLDHSLFTVEKLQFQSLPGLYVTANLYLPKGQQKPAPAILYLCGHARVITNGISYGNKTAYQHHGAWFARNGYVCLTIDTVQLGELEGIHHGTYREGMWWWNSRGYTSAGVEAWNSIRALDYLESRPEADRSRIGVTGRSGGGAYSWWVAALDDRVKAAAPIAGITDLENHVVDGTVEGHCDCMFMMNTYGWDYPLVAALIAPRPLLIGNSDKDSIFPLDGVVRLHAQVKRIYDLYQAGDKLGLLVTEGPHKDTQDLQIPVFRWFNRHLKGEDPLIEMAAVKFFTPQELKVFPTKPDDERTTKIQETFVPLAESAVPNTRAEWARQRDQWLALLKQKSFGGWPDHAGSLEMQRAYSVERGGIRLEAFDFSSEPEIRLRLYLACPTGLKGSPRVALTVLNDQNWSQWLESANPLFGEQLSAELKLLRPGRFANEGKKDFLRQWQTNKIVAAYLAPRGIGLTAWTPNERKQIQIRRRFMLLGQTLDGMRVWDIRRGIEALRSIKKLKGAHPLELEAEGPMAVNALYAALFEQTPVAELDLWRLPQSQREGPDYLNVLRFLDIPQAVAMAAERSRVRLYQADSGGWDYPAAVAQALDWDDNIFTIELLPLVYSQ